MGGLSYSRAQPLANLFRVLFLLTLLYYIDEQYRLLLARQSSCNCKCLRHALANASASVFRNTRTKM